MTTDRAGAAQPATGVEAARASDVARVNAELAQARAAAARAERQAVQAAATSSNTQVSTGEGGRLTRIVGADGHVTEIRTGAAGDVTITKDGKTILATGPGAPAPDVIATPSVPPMPELPPMTRNDDIPAGVFRLIVILLSFAMLAIIGVPMVRSYSRRMDRKATPADPDLTRRLDRIEQAVEAIAVEVERVSEAQRYSARLLTERLPETAPRVAAAEHAT